MNRSAVASGPTLPEDRDWFVFTFFLSVFAYLYANLALLCGIPLLLNGDQVYFWMEAQRLARGEKIYHDFLQFTPPGTDLVYLAFFRVFGQRLWVTNAIVALLGVALCWICFRLACQLMRPRLALLPTMLFFVLVYGRLLNATHHFFSLFFCMAAALVFRSDRPRIALAAMFLGIAAFFTQTHAVAVLLALSIYLIASSVRQQVPWKTIFFDQATLFLVFASMLLLLSLYFLADVGFREIWYHQVTYVRNYVRGAFPGTFLGIRVPVGWRALPALSQYLFVCALPLVVCPLALWLIWRSRNTAPTSEGARVVRLSLVGLFLFLEVANNPNWFRLYTISMPSLIIFVWLISHARRCSRALCVFACTALLLLALGQTFVRQRHDYVVATLPAGTVAIDSKAFIPLNAVLQRTHPGDYFFQAIWPGLYFPLQLRNPLYVDTVWPSEETRPEFVERAVHELALRPTRYILWSHSIDGPERGNESADHLSPLRSYLRENYRKVEQLPDGAELWERE